MLLTRPPLMQGASPLHPFDLHVLSTPPAFILSQNQTLKINCLKPICAKHISGSNLNKFSLSFCWLCFEYYCSKKLTETAFCVTKNRFFPILFLICVKRTTVRRRPFKKSSLSIIIQAATSCQAFLHNFLKNFLFFQKSYKKRLSANSLIILSYPFFIVN